MADPAGKQRRIAIIGSGFSGLCLAIQLKKAGIDSFTIYEKSDRLGGTWRENTYPGAACDVPSMLYCFSFEQKTDWSRLWSPQAEIHAYMEHCARTYDIEPHIRFNTEIAAARYDATDAVWRLRTAGGEEVVADVLVSAVGQLNRPAIPAIPGLDRFRGAAFHSAQWDHSYDIAGKRVAVVGNAASAIQFIPEIATAARHVFIFQRTPNWMLPRGDRAYTEREHQMLADHPWLARLSRWWIWLMLEIRFPMIRNNRLAQWWVRRAAEQYLLEGIADARLRATLRPNYPLGGKRILISDDYYRTLERDNVDLVTRGIERITESALITCDGVAYPVDAVILATGFHTTAFLAPMRIEGLEGRVLESEWANGARAYRGVAVAGFPNLFLMYGPNTNLGHNSIIFMIECQTRYILGAIRTLIRRDLASLDVRRQVMDAADARIQRQLARTVWAATEASWYKTETGRITNNWSGSTARYWWLTRWFDAARYHQRRQQAVQRDARGDALSSGRAA